MSPSTQIGKIKLPYKVHDKEGHIPSESFNFNRSREFSEDFTSKDWLEFASRWLHLATYDELLDDIEEYLRTQITYVRQYSKDGLRNVMYRINENKPVVYSNEKDPDYPRKYIFKRIETMPEMEE